MPNCSACYQVVATIGGRLPEYCPHCGAATDVAADAPHAPWAPVARVGSLSELGYFEDLLIESGFNPRLLDDDEFDAMGGSWRGTYTICVPAQQAAEAAALIESHLMAGDAEEDEYFEQSASQAQHGGRFGAGQRAARDRGDDADKSVSWTPVVACLLAGGLAYWGGSSLLEASRPAQPAHEQADLWQALEELDRPLATADGQRPRTVLRVDRHRHVIWLEEDHNGDGRVDVRRQFRGGELVEH